MGCFCGAKAYKLLFTSSGYLIVQCVICGQARTITPPRVERKQVYNKEDTSVYIKNEEMFRAIFRRIVSFIRQYKKYGTFFDVGAGVGLLVDEAQRVGFQASGIEPSHSAVHAAKRFFGVTLKQAKISSKLALKRFDTVVLNHVLEHLPNPKNVIRIIDRTLLKDGLLVIGVPNFHSIIGQIKKDRWQNIIPEQHRWHFTLQTLDQLILPFGFVRCGFFMENHDRSMHSVRKRVIYFFLDKIALAINQGEAMLIVYQKT